MIPLTTLYDEYIDRPKLTEQKDYLIIQFLPPQVGRSKYQFAKIDHSGDKIEFFGFKIYLFLQFMELL